MMEWQTLINLVLALIVGFVGWFAHEIWDSMKELRRDFHQIEKDLPEFYVRKDEFRDALREVKADIHARFDKLENMMSLFMDRLNDKADK